MNDFQRLPNQRKVVIRRHKVGRDNFFLADNESVYNALRSLNYGELRLWLMLSMNADGFNYCISPARLFMAGGLADSTYRDAWKGLIKKGFIENDGTAKNNFVFYEYPDNRDSSTKSEDESRNSAESSRNPSEKKNVKNKENRKNNAAQQTIVEPFKSDGEDGSNGFLL